MSRLFRLLGTTPRDPDIDAWLAGPSRLGREIDALIPEPADGLRAMARDWLEVMRAMGPDVREVMHDGCPTACVQDAAFGYVNVFKAHVGVGFFNGADLDDPARLLEGSGKRMRHVKLRLGEPVDVPALKALVAASYQGVRARLASEGA
jgi:hypothetical protein